MHRLVLCVLAVALASCVPTSFKWHNSNAPSLPENVGTVSDTTVVDYGNGVLHFHHTGAHFGNALSAYLSQHPDLEVTAISGDSQGSNGSHRGYFVTVETKAIN